MVYGMCFVLFFCSMQLLLSVLFTGILGWLSQKQTRWDLWDHFMTGCPTVPQPALLKHLQISQAA